MKNPAEPILNGRAAIRSEKQGPAYWVCRPDGTELERLNTRDLAVARAEALIKKGAL